MLLRAIFYRLRFDDDCLLIITYERLGADGKKRGVATGDAFELVLCHEYERIVDVAVEEIEVAKYAHRFLQQEDHSAKDTGQSKKVGIIRLGEDHAQDPGI